LSAVVTIIFDTIDDVLEKVPNEKTEILGNIRRRGFFIKEPIEAYAIVHEILKEKYSVEYRQIERDIINNLRERIHEDKYSLNDKVEAVSVITDVICMITR
jgi:hypothetical protein